MDTLVTVIHFITASLMIVLILMQQGKGAEMGASFGGGGANTVFGSSGGGSFFGKLTAVLAVVFFLTSLGLALFAKNASSVNLTDDIPFLETVAPESDLPSISVDTSVSDLPSFDAEIEQTPVSDVVDDVESPAIEIPVE